MTQYTVDYKALGLKIRQLRLQHGMTQEKLAERAGVSVNYISNIETANSKFSMNVLLTLANVFGIGTDSLFGEQLVVCKNQRQQKDNELVTIIENGISCMSDEELRYIVQTIELINKIKYGS